MEYNFFFNGIAFLDIRLNYSQGDINDHQSLVKAIKQADVVISTVNHQYISDQYKIISAIKEAGNIKVYIYLKSQKLL